MHERAAIMTARFLLRRRFSKNQMLSLRWSGTMAKASIEVTSTLYHNGQTTIPSEIRKRLRLKRGDQIVYRMARDGRVILTPRKKGYIKHLYGMLGPAIRKATVDQMNDSIADAVCQRVLGG
ncbi:MAG: type II toxin-antitoxin system PrlF family antitoxin [Candidatus Binataceae bacterium]|jgi:AbrB family looped-hinge helix DNA binding protein